MRDQSISIQEDELPEINVLIEKGGPFYLMFSIVQSIIRLKVSETRMDNLAEKRSDKRTQIVVMPPPTTQFPPTWVVPCAPPQSADEMQRVISISDLSKSSAGSKLFHVFHERE